MTWEVLHQLKQSQPADRLKELWEYLLTARNLTSVADQAEFLSPPSPDLSLIDKLPDLDLGQLKQAAKLVEKAISARQPILVYGDYDCDGVCATALLWETLYELGADAKPFIPRRDDHGYGLSLAGLTEALAQFDRDPLVITVDNGITAKSVIESFPQLQFIVTDHHQKSPELPPAVIVHSQQVCGAGIAWILASFLRQKPVSPELVALATVCDLLPLRGPSRQFVIWGLKELVHTVRPGLLALFELAGVNRAALETYHLGYILGPRLNAAGRLGRGLDALRLLCTQKPLAAQALAQKLSLLNQDRQDLTETHLDTAIAGLPRQPLPKVLVVASDQFHEGIIGLVAAKLAERFHRPAVAVSIKDGQVKGSARSIKGIHITNLLTQANPGGIELGGHGQAAGFKSTLVLFAKFKKNILKLANEIDDQLFIARLPIDAELMALDLSLDLVEHLEQLAPFGTDNERPLFSLTAKLAAGRPVGQRQNHLQLNLITDKQNVKAIGFNLASRWPEIESSSNIEVAFNLTKNIYQGRTNFQLQLKDFRPAQDL